MSLLDNNYDFDAMESIIDFKVKWHDPINHIGGENDTAAFNLPKDLLYNWEESDLWLFINSIDRKILREYITKLKEYYSIFSNRILEFVCDDNTFYNYFEWYKVRVSFLKDIISIEYIPDPDIPHHHPDFNFTICDGRMTIKGALENAIFYNVLCEIEKGLD